MKFKRIIALIMLSAMMLGVLGGCAVKEAETDTTDTDTGEETTEEVYVSAEDSVYPYYSQGLDENGFFEGVTASDIVTLPEYKGIGVSSTLLVADEDDVEDQISQILEDYAYYEQITDKAIEDGDTVNIDYVGSVDGVEFDGGSTQGNGTTVTIGVTSYIDDFLEQLIGHTPGENFDIEVTFPDPYTNNTDLSGKDAIFNITINYIQGDEVIPEISDEVAEDYGFSSVDELKDDIRDWLVEQQTITYVDSIIATAECSEIPDSVIEYYRNYMEGYYTAYAENYGVELDTFMTYYGYEDFDDFFESNGDSVNDMALKALAYQAIAEIEGIGVTGDDITEAGYTGYATYYGTGYVYQNVLSAYVIPNFIMDNAVMQ
jgi:trigger factor